MTTHFISGIVSSWLFRLPHWSSLKQPSAVLEVGIPWFHLQRFVHFFKGHWNQDLETEMGTRKHTTPPYPHPASPFMCECVSHVSSWAREGCTSERACWNEQSSFINQTYPLENSHIPRLEEGFHLQICFFQKLLLNTLKKKFAEKIQCQVPRKVNLSKTKSYHHQNQSCQHFCHRSASLTASCAGPGGSALASSSGMRDLPIEMLILLMEEIRLTSW